MTPQPIKRQPQPMPQRPQGQAAQPSPANIQALVRQHLMGLMKR